MNKEIELIFKDFAPTGTDVPVAFMDYQGESVTYLVYNSAGDAPALSADNDLLNSVISYDVHIYSTSNYDTIEAAVKALLKAAGWTWTGSPADLYEPDTGYYHKINNFEKERSY